MDSLLAEINAKKRQLRDGSDEAESSSSAKKYKTRGEIEAEAEEEQRKKRAEEADRRERLKAESRARQMRKEAEAARKNASARMASPGAGTSAATSTEVEAFNVSPEECTRRLRLLRQPIRLFGETDRDRKLRLRALELSEERGEGLQNDFKRTLDSLETETEEKKLAELARLAHAGKAADAIKQAKKDEKSNGAADRSQEGVVLDLKLVKDEPNKVYPLIYYALKNVLKEWEEWMDARPEDVKRSGQGKMAAATQAQSAQNLKPLFKLLRNRNCAPDVLRGLAEIVHFMQTRSYQKANDSYLRLSIGTAAWPIGVTSVGIHERSSQDKLYVDKIAHVLNDEVSRKWIQAVKRLLTFSQSVRPPKEISQMMG